MSKLELELQRLRLQSQYVQGFMQLVKHLLTMATIIICIYIMFEAIRDMVRANPASISAMAELIKQLKFNDVIGYIVGTAATTAWYIERKGKKRLVAQSASSRRGREGNDAYRGSSGLTETGDTPKLEGGSK